VLAGGYLVVMWQSATDLARRSDGYAARRYVDKYLASAAAIRRTDPNIWIYDQELPLVAAGFYPYDLASRTIGDLDRKARFNPSSTGYVITIDGALHPARFVKQGDLTASPRQGCVGPAPNTAALVLSAGTSLPGGPWFIRFSYRSPTGARLVIGGRVVNVAAGDGVVVTNLPPGPFRAVAVYVAPGASLCVGPADVGQPQPIA
jgi:hypothetical protein